MPQCEFLFSAVFVFQKSCTENILGIARDKNPGPYFSVTKPEPEGEQQRASRVSRDGPGAAIPGPALGVSLGPLGLHRLHSFAHCCLLIATLTREYNAVLLPLFPDN